MRLTPPALVFSSALWLLVTASPAAAQKSASLVPSVSVATVYDDNLFARKQGDAGVITRVRPAMEGLYESPTVKVFGFGSFDMQRSNHAALNTFDARRHGLFDVRHQTTPQLSLMFGLRYDQTETPGELNLDSGVLGDRRRAERWELIPAIEYRVRPRTAIRASYSGTTEALFNEPVPVSRGIDLTPTVIGGGAASGTDPGSDAIVSMIVGPSTVFADLRGNLQVVRAGVSRLTSPRNEISVGYLGRIFTDNVSADSNRSNAVLVGWTRDLMFGTRLILQGGPRVSTFSGVAPEIVVGFSRNTNRLQLALDYWHGESIILGIPGPVAVDSTTARMIWPVRPRIEIGTHFGVSNSQTIEEEQARVYRTNLVGSWTPNGGPYTLSASYGLDFQQGVIRRTALSEDQVFRHTLRVNVTIAPRLSRTYRPTGEPPVERRGGESQ
jgi:hypothetical protein